MNRSDAAIRFRHTLAIRAALVWALLDATGAAAGAADYFVAVAGSDLDSGAGPAVDLITKTLSI